MANVITTQPMANNDVPENDSPEAAPSDINAEEEKKKKKQDDELSEIVEDCCCYYDHESFILLRCISEICRCMATCTEHCCESCGDCIQNSCEGNEGDEGGGDCCDCWGSNNVGDGGNGGDSDCDCDCDCTS